MKRRTLLLSGGAAAGALLVGWSLLPARSRLGAAALMREMRDEFALNGWIRIATDGTVVLAMPRSEMGQGVHTALPMLVAEELDVPLGRVRVEQSGSDAIYGNVAMLVASLPFHPQEGENDDGFNRVQAGRWFIGKLGRELGINATGGSSSVSDLWEVLRTAAATARASLLGAASLEWRLPVAELTVADGVVTHPSGKSASYGELARFAAATRPGTVRVKARKDWKLIGTAAARQDIPAKVDGSARFGLDVRLPDMRFAAIRMCPMLGGSPGAMDAEAALRLPGVERLVRLPAYAGATAGFAVVGRTSWHARQGAAAVDVRWHAPPGVLLDSARIDRELEQAVRDRPGHVFFERGTPPAADAARVLEAWYRAPYLAHAALEPLNCTAQVADGKVTLWMPTQVPEMARDAAARVAGVALGDVTIHVTLLGGGFGRRLEVDAAAQAVRIAMDCGGKPVQLLWPREEDTVHDFYRPMQVVRLRGTLDGAGKLASLDIKSAGDAITPRWIERAMPSLAGPVDVPDKTTSEGLFDLPYAIASQRMEHVATRMRVPVGFWRSVGHSHNAFFSESFIDEMAQAAGRDPVDFRRELLAHAPRHRAVLNLAAEKSGWGRPLPAGRGRGVALHESFGSIVCQVAEISMEKDVPRVHRVVCALDCGTVVNPDIVAQQMEGSVVFALSAALQGRIDIREGAVAQGNFHDYPMVRLSNTPAVETWIVRSDRSPSGVGEPGVPPLAPAVSNAIHALNGTRIRTLPLARLTTL